MLGWVGLGALVVVALVLLKVLSGIEDWRRDFTTNRAATRANHPDPRLRPISAPLPPADLAALAEAAGAAVPGFAFTGRAEEGTALILRFVYTTPWMRFRDDVTLRIVPEGTGARLDAESRSRIGKGDLGQNPRNLRALLGAIRARLEAAAPATGR